MSPTKLARDGPVESAISSLAGEMNHHELRFYNWTISRMHTFSFLNCVWISCFHITDDEERHYNLTFIGETWNLCGPLSKFSVALNIGKLGKKRRVKSLYWIPKSDSTDIPSNTPDISMCTFNSSEHSDYVHIIVMLHRNVYGDIKELKNVSSKISLQSISKTFWHFTIVGTIILIRIFPHGST